MSWVQEKRKNIFLGTYRASCGRAACGLGVYFEFCCLPQFTFRKLVIMDRGDYTFQSPFKRIHKFLEIYQVCCGWVACGLGVYFEFCCLPQSTFRKLVIMDRGDYTFQSPFKRIHKFLEIYQVCCGWVTCGPGVDFEFC